MRRWLFALVAAVGFAMAAWYTTATDHPANLHSDTRTLLAHWKLHGMRGVTLQSSLAVGSGLLGVLAWWHSNEVWFLMSALVLFADVPLTRWVFAPVSRRLEAIDPTSVSDATRRLLLQWGDLLVMRGLLGTVGAALVVLAIVSP